jgi:glutamate-1-semialdehyde 2,1-aminomutase
MISHLVGGISSLGRALPKLRGQDFLVERAEGAWLWDIDGNSYIDTAMGFGATVLGHAFPSVVEAVGEALRFGPMPAFAHRREEAAASALARHTGDLDRVVFVNSGSEAVHLACRIARAETRRPRIAKLAAGYDGWYDQVAFGTAGSSEAAMTANSRPRNDDFSLLRYNDFDDVDRLFAEDPGIAAVIVEPVLANAGTILPAPGYLNHLQTVARRHGALVIADEVLMGFRLGCGLTSHALGLDPDLATLGKAIGSGIAVAAVVGTAKVMAGVECGLVVRAGTYSGNPVACAAVIATIAELETADYAALLARGDGLRHKIARIGDNLGLPISTSGFGNVFTIWFSPEPPKTYAEALTLADSSRTQHLHRELRQRGVLIMPFAFGRVFLSFAHDAATLARLETAARDALGALANTA